MADVPVTAATVFKLLEVQLLHNAELLLISVSLHAMPFTSIHVIGLPLPSVAHCVPTPTQVFPTGEPQRSVFATTYFFWTFQVFVAGSSRTIAPPSPTAQADVYQMELLNQRKALTDLSGGMSGSATRVQKLPL